MWSEALWSEDKPLLASDTLSLNAFMVIEQSARQLATNLTSV